MMRLMRDLKMSRLVSLNHLRESTFLSSYSLRPAFALPRVNEFSKLAHMGLKSMERLTSTGLYSLG